MQILEQLIKFPDEVFAGTTDYCRNELLVSPMFEALLDCNILYKSKYFETFHVEHKLYVSVIE